MTRQGDPNAPLRVAWRRARERAFTTLTPIGSVAAVRAVNLLLAGADMAWAARLPVRPLRRGGPPVWPVPSRETPAQLRGVAGIRRDPQAESEAYAQRPLHAFLHTHIEAARYFLGHGWNYLLPSLPRLLQGTAVMRSIDRSGGAPPAASVPRSPGEVTALVRAEAARLGLSAVGFTTYDERYAFQEFGHRDEEVNVVVCIVEQDWAATQTAPSGRAERSVFRAYNDNLTRVAALTRFLQSLGYSASPQDQEGAGVHIQYAVNAGLGQLGLNGQLLTPQAGSRCRLAAITTDAPLELGEPTDFGIEPICDACQICVRRCPPGAIPKTRREHRGVVKAKIKPERCFPIMAQAHGCAICMKACPVQRYGLDAVRDLYVRTGTILGKGTDELEGFVWPLDGRYYGPGEKPRMSREVLNPPGWHFDPTRTAPVAPEPEAEPATDAERQAYSPR